MDFNFRRLQRAFNVEGNREQLSPLTQQYIRALERMLYSQSPDFGYVSEAGLLDARMAVLVHTDFIEFIEYLESIGHESQLFSFIHENKTIKFLPLFILHTNEDFGDDTDLEAIELRRILFSAKREGYQLLAIPDSTILDEEPPEIDPPSFPRTTFRIYNAER